VTRSRCLAIVVLLTAALARLALSEEASASSRDQAQGPAPEAISGNPAAENILPGNAWLTGLIPGRPFDESGLHLGGVWLADANGLISGGAEPGKWSWNSALIVGANFDAQKLGWTGASFGIQFLQFNGENTNGQAGSVQGYNSLPGPPPLDRSELYQLWYRQTLFDKRIILRIGKVVPTFDFNNVARPVPSQNRELSIPAVTGLLYTPIFVNPTLLGAIGGYYNSVCGLTVTVAPTKNSYLSYGFYDGNVILGVQTGMTGPHFNGYYFNIWEAGLDWVVFNKYPGQFGAGLWYQSGLILRPNVSQDGTGGLYIFGSQRIWSNSTHTAFPRSVNDGKSTNAIAPAEVRPASISTFVQFGVNNAEVLPVNQSFGMGFTGFGLVPGRAADSLGVGMSWAWLNPKAFDRPSELMFQGYYQAHLVAGTFFQPAITYIPTPGASSSLGGAWALTFRVTVLF
jgi:porin